ncbi:hypothetical protein [Sphingomonas sp.]|uniref:hypothetical protein n=1 Tax=Sphingomonas sp. TaxID=28214 RepID=UPI002DD6264E|nr:hypothetical protein [Sphingomonas sp.]
MIAIVPSLIAAVTVVLGALVTFILNRRMQLDAAWRSEKLEYYKELIDAVAQNVEGMASSDTQREFARASNNLLLIAPDEVLSAHHAYREHISHSNVGRDYSKDSQLLAALVDAIRSDLRMPGHTKFGPEQARLWTSNKRP